MCFILRCFEREHSPLVSYSVNTSLTVVENSGHITWIRLQAAAARAALLSATSAGGVLVFTYVVMQQGKYLLPFFDFQRPWDLLRSKPEAHGSHVLFVLIPGTLCTLEILFAFTSESKR